jgi:hypothetical protein
MVLGAQAAPAISELAELQKGLSSETATLRQLPCLGFGTNPAPVWLDV